MKTKIAATGEPNSPCFIQIEKQENGDIEIRSRMPKRVTWMTFTREQAYLLGEFLIHETYE